MSGKPDVPAVLAALGAVAAGQQALGRSLQAARLELAGRWWRANLAKVFAPRTPARGTEGERGGVSSSSPPPAPPGAPPGPYP
jgi:hypothetical protein